MTDPTTPEPGERSFEDLLADPLEQFDVRSEILPAVLDYSAAPSGTVSAQPPTSTRLVCLPAAEVERLRQRAAKAEAAIAEVRRLCNLTIAASCRAQAIDQAVDTLAVLDRALAAPEATTEETNDG